MSFADRKFSVEQLLLSARFRVAPWRVVGDSAPVPSLLEKPCRVGGPNGLYHQCTVPESGGAAWGLGEAGVTLVGSGR